MDRSPRSPRCLVSCKKSRALCHCSPVYDLVGLAGFAMNFSKKWVVSVVASCAFGKGWKWLYTQFCCSKWLFWQTRHYIMLFSIRCFFKIILSANQTLMVIILSLDSLNLFKVYNFNIFQLISKTKQNTTCTTCKTNGCSPENTPRNEKEIHLNQTIIFRFYVHLRGCKYWYKTL